MDFLTETNYHQAWSNHADSKQMHQHHRKSHSAGFGVVEPFQCMRHDISISGIDLGQNCCEYSWN